MNKWKLGPLPLKTNVESRTILKRLPRAHFRLAELKGIANTIPNQNILLNTVALQEAKDSSEIENIITTFDQLYKSELRLIESLESKEVQNYIAAIKSGYELMMTNRILDNKVIHRIQEKINLNNAGYRKVPGPVLRNASTGEVIYNPPQDLNEIKDLMSNLETYINDDSLSDLDPLVKMAIIHFQFESIHPFYDGNGRTGRIINILYLVLKGLLDMPILFLSHYITKNKTEYYRLIQKVRNDHLWEEWIIFMIDAVEETSLQTIKIILEIKNLMEELKLMIKSKYKFYSHELINNIFNHPYTKIEFVVRDLQVSRLTAGVYLNTLAKDGILKKEKLGKSNYYINWKLMELLKS